MTEAELADAAQLASLADETPEGRSIVVLAKERYGLRERELVGATLVPFTAQTRMSGVDLDGRSIRKGAADSVRRWIEENGGSAPAELEPRRGADRRLRRNPAGRRRKRAGPRSHPSQGRRQGGHARAVRAAPRDGDSHGHDHRRQPADGEGDRRGGRRRRLPRRGDARGQDGADPPRAGRRRARSDDRRRDERRAGARPGRRGRGDEHGHAGGARRPGTWSTSTRTRRS